MVGLGDHFNYLAPNSHQFQCIHRVKKMTDDEFGAPLNDEELMALAHGVFLWEWHSTDCTGGVFLWEWHSTDCTGGVFLWEWHSTDCTGGVFVWEWHSTECTGGVFLWEWHSTDSLRLWKLLRTANNFSLEINHGV